MTLVAPYQVLRIPQMAVDRKPGCMPPRTDCALEAQTATSRGTNLAYRSGILDDSEGLAFAEYLGVVKTDR